MLEDTNSLDVAHMKNPVLGIPVEHDKLKIVATGMQHLRNTWRVDVERFSVLLKYVFDVVLVFLLFCKNAKITVMILSFRTDTPGQTVQTQIRLPFRLHRLDSLLYGRAT